MSEREERIEAMTKRHREYIDSITDIYMPRMGFVYWLGYMLKNTGFFEAMYNDTFNREDALSVLSAHWSGHIDAHKPHPWEWYDNGNYSIKEVQRAIDISPSHEVYLEQPEAIDGLTDATIETVEIEFFLHNLEKTKDG